jgi:hypothetical protein
VADVTIWWPLVAWTDPQLELDGLAVRSWSMPKLRKHQYSIEIRNAKGQVVVFTKADWNSHELRLALAQLLRLDGVIEPLTISPLLGKDGESPKLAESLVLIGFAKKNPRHWDQRYAGVILPKRLRA